MRLNRGILSAAVIGLSAACGPGLESGAGADAPPEGASQAQQAQRLTAVKPRTAVVLGDSFASGEGGRWSGNSFEGIDEGNRAGTDRAARWGSPVAATWNYNLDFPYMAASVDNGCDRSNWAPITYLKTQGNYGGPYAQVVNLACSGARNEHLWPPTAGGASFKGESPQIPRLAAVAATHDIDLIVIGVGGNDMGFANAIKQCALAWVSKHWTFEDNDSCVDELQNSILPKLGDVYVRTVKTLHHVRQQMAAIGDADYRIVLTGYPNIIPDSGGWAYDAGLRRVRRCPINGPDSDFVDQVLVPKLNATVESIAQQEGVDFINLHRAFDGHRLCQDGLGSRVTGAQPATSQNTEWVRYLDTTGLSMASASKFKEALQSWSNLTEGATLAHIAGDQGSISESFHPNEFGQRAVGHCLLELETAGTAGADAVSCRPGSSGHATDMVLQALPAPTMVHSTTNVAIPDGGGAVNVHKSVPANAEPGKVMRSEVVVTHPRKGNLRITVRAPSGKVYPVREVNLNDTGAFPSVHRSFFYDAPAEAGTWTLRVEDQVAGYAGTLTDWKLFFF